MAAIMGINGIRSILTFNISDFVRFPDLNAVHPNDVRAISGQPADSG